MGSVSPSPIALNCCQQASTSGMFAMSAIEQPAVMFGRTTICFAEVRMSALSAMKWTPQNTMNFACGVCAARRASLNESPVSSANWIISSRW